MAELPMSTDAKYLANQVVLVGWGRVGKRIADALTAAGVPFVVADENRESVETLRQRGIPAVWGNATDPMVLVQAHIRDARALVIATPETIEVRRMVEIARTLNPDIEVVVRSHNREEARRLEAEGAGTVFVAEQALAAAMVRHVLDRVKAARASSTS
jgi:CPA2 family monovalent cation:H+ antiporter-2